MRIVSGIQPSGGLHLGNYLGALRQFLALQHDHACLFFIADWHALTSGTLALSQRVREMAADYLALGLDPSKCILFRQSDVPQHLELAWILAGVAPVGLLERAHSYKDKVARGLPANVGLFTYPVLMAADILLYGQCAVPAGPDQKQHIEMAADLAVKFNVRHQPGFDPNHPTGGGPDGAPAGILTPPVAQSVRQEVVPGLDGRKMSKSYDNTLELFGDEKPLRRKIMSMVTDSTPVEAPKPPDSPLLGLLMAVLPEAEAAATQARWLAGGVGYGAFKKQLAEAFFDLLGAARQRRHDWLARPDDLEDIFRDGARRAREAAAPTWNQVAEVVGCGRRLAPGPQPELARV